jgi:hypothetical protein
LTGSFAFIVDWVWNERGCRKNDLIGQVEEEGERTCPVNWFYWTSCKGRRVELSSKLILLDKLGRKESGVVQ